tara:strand:- start:397 stop:540 length:144 start_codon:yes stop_codon:yes gene_type:complete
LALLAWNDFDAVDLCEYVGVAFGTGGRGGGGGGGGGFFGRKNPMLCS